MQTAQSLQLHLILSQSNGPRRSSCSMTFVLCNKIYMDKVRLIITVINLNFVFPWTTVILHIKLVLDNLLIYNILVIYRILPKTSPLLSSTSKFLHRYFYLVYKTPSLRCKNCTVSKNGRVAIDNTTVIRSLNGLSSSFVSSFC